MAKRARVHRPNHPAASAKGYVYEYRLIAERKLGRLLTRGEVVHHVNGDESDNRPENLQVMTQSEHATLHGYERYSSPGVDPFTQKRCPRCQLVLPRTSMPSNGICKPCNAALQRIRRAERKERA